METSTEEGLGEETDEGAAHVSTRQAQQTETADGTESDVVVCMGNDSFHSADGLRFHDAIDGAELVVENEYEPDEELGGTYRTDTPPPQDSPAKGDIRDESTDCDSFHSVCGSNTLYDVENPLVFVEDSSIDLHDDESVVMVPPSHVHILSADSGDSGSESSGRIPIWERLPVATPIFEAEVDVWQFNRPKHKHHFGRGFYGDEDQDNGDENETRTPIFSEQDRSNPVRCLGKLLGIILALPLYVIYKFLTLAWVPRFLRISDRSIARPIGWLMDGLVFLSISIIWCSYVALLVPFYKYGLVYPCRGVRKVTLVSVTALVKGVIWFFHTRCCQGVIKSVSLLVKGTRNYILIPAWNGLAATPSLILKYLVNPPIDYIVKPAWRIVVKGISVAFGAVKSAVMWIHKKALQPFCNICWTWVICVVKTTAKCVCTVSRWVYDSVMTPFYVGLVSGLSLVHKLLILPLRNCLLAGLKCTRTCLQMAGKGLYDYILAPFGKGFVSGLSCMYKQMIAPVFRCGVTCLKSTGACVVSAVKGVYKSMVVPFFRGFKSGVVCIQKHVIVPLAQGVVGAFQAVHRSIVVPTGRILLAALSSVGGAISATMAAVGRILSALGSAIKELFSQLGDAIATLATRITRVFK